MIRIVSRSCLLLMLLTTVTFGERAHAELSADTELARVDGETITYLDLVRLAKSRYVLKAQPVTDPAVINRLMDELIFEAVARKEGLNVDLSSDWNYRHAVIEGTTLAAIQLYYNEVLLPQISLDSSMVDSFYQANIDRYTVPRRQRFVQQITVYKQGKGLSSAYLTVLDSLYVGWDPKRKIDSLYTRLMNGEDFGRLAVLYSEEPRARSTAGTWGWTSGEGIGDSILARVVFDQPLYRISKPIDLGYGWAILYIKGEREAGSTPKDESVIDDVRSQLQQQIGRRLADHLKDSLSDAAHLDYIDKFMQRPDSELVPGNPLVIVNRTDTIFAADYLLYKNTKQVLRETGNLTPAQREQALNSLSRNVVLYQAFRTWGYTERPEIQHLQNGWRVRAGYEAVMTRVNDVPTPTESEIANYYNEHIREFTPERRHFIQSRIFGASDSASALAQAWQGGKAPDWVDSRWIGPDDVPNTVWNRIAGVPPGTVIGPLVATGGYWVVKLDRIAQPKSLGEVRSLIWSKLSDLKLERARERWMKSVANRHQIVRHEDLIDNAALPTGKVAGEMLAVPSNADSTNYAPIFDD